MVIEAGLERDCHLLGTVFASVISELKNSNGAWEDLLSKASKLQSAVKNSCSALSGFLDALQKIADMATNTKGATREIGSSLTRLCLRHRTLEQRLRDLSNKMLDGFVGPMQEHAEDWRRSAFAIDKDHSREIKRARQDLKRMTNEALKAQKKAKKGNLDAQYQLDQLFQELSDRYAVLEQLQRNALRVALREERARYCYFIACLKPVMDEEVAILDERNNVREILDLLSSQAVDPENLPEASEQAIRDLQGHQVRVWEVLRTKVASGGIDDTVGSDGGSLSRKSSSLCSIDDDDEMAHSDDEASLRNGGVATGKANGHHHQDAIQHGVLSGMGSRNKIQRKLSEVLTSSARMSSVNATAIGGSYDSGFMSQAEQHHYAAANGNGAQMMYMSSNVSSSTASTSMMPSDAGSGGSPESEPGIVLGGTAKHQQQQQQQQVIMTGGMMNGASTMRPHTISAAFSHHQQQQQRQPLCQALFDPPHRQQQQQQIDVYEAETDGGSSTLLHLSKPVPPPRIPIRLNALDQPAPLPSSIPLSASGSDSVSITSGDYAPIYANANELAVIAANAVAANGNGYHHLQQRQQQQSHYSGPVVAENNGALSRRQRSMSSSSGNDGLYLELQPIAHGGVARSKTPQAYASHQQMRVHPTACDEQSLALAMRQLECTVTQLNSSASNEAPNGQNMYYQTNDGVIYASVPMPGQPGVLPPRQPHYDSNATIRRAPSNASQGSATKPTPPVRRGSTETLSMLHPGSRLQQQQQQQQQQQPPPPPPPQQQQQQQVIYQQSRTGAHIQPQQTPKCTNLQNRTQLGSNSAAAVAAVVDHALAVGSSHQNGGISNVPQVNRVMSPSPQPAIKGSLGKLPQPNGSLHQQLHQQLNQALTQRTSLSSQQRSSSLSSAIETVQVAPSSQQPQLKQQPQHVVQHPPLPPPAATAVPTINNSSSQQASRARVVDATSKPPPSSTSGDSSPPSTPPSSGNQLLQALQSKRQQLRKTVPNDRSAPKFGR